MRISRSIAALFASVLLCLPFAASAQGAPAANALPQDQLDGLLAPIALYPDQLLSQVLMASTYPLEVVEAYAPHAFTSHLKDMGVEEYPAGFRLAEVPLGQGVLDGAMVEVAAYCLERS